MAGTENKVVEGLTQQRTWVELLALIETYPGTKFHNTTLIEFNRKKTKKYIGKAMQIKK